MSTPRLGSLGWTGHRRGFAAFAAGLAGAGLVACAPQDGGTAPGGAAGGTPGAPGRLRIGVSFDVRNLSPYDSGFWLTSYGAAQSLYRVTPEDAVVPWIASAITADGQEGYTIKLDPRARFHNGKPIDARQVQTAIQRHLDGGVRDIPSLKGARWESPDPRTLRVRTSQPDPWLPNYLALAYLPIFDVDEVPAKEALDGDALNALAGKGFASGPFRITRLTPQEMLLEAVPDAWDGAPRLATVEVRFIRDLQARLAALKTGEIDLMLYPQADSVPQIKETPGLTFKVTPSAGRRLLYFNHSRPPCSDRAVRLAISLGIDRKPIAEAVLNGAETAPDTLYPPQMPWTVPGLVRTDLAQARRLLDEAGWRPGPDGIRVKDGRRLSLEWLHYPQQPATKAISEAAQAQLKTLGLEVRLRQVDDLNAAMRTREWDAAVGGGAMQQAGNPVGALNQSYRTDSPRNYGGWGSPELDGLIGRLNTEFDPARRNDLLKSVQEIFRRDALLTSTTSSGWPVALNATFRGYEPTHDVDHYIVRKDVAPSPGR